MSRYQWRVLPQGMANSPTLCQKFVAQTIASVRLHYASVMIIHYMDDILLADGSQEILHKAYNDLLMQLKNVGLQVAEQKVQLAYPYSYLGFHLFPRHFMSQRLKLKLTNYTTLNDFQKLLGDINWLRPSLKITTEDLRPLFELLKGDPTPTSTRIMTTEAKRALAKVENALSSATLSYCDYSLPWQLLILPTPHTPTGVLYQRGVLQWLHGSNSSRKALPPYYSLVAERIKQGRKSSILHLGRDPHEIIISYNAEQLQWLLNMTDDFPVALANFMGKVSFHFPRDKIIHFASLYTFTFYKIVQFYPINDAITLFTDGSSNGKAVLVGPNDIKTWDTHLPSAQIAELFAVYQALLLYSEAFNLYSDSSYVTKSLQVLETVPTIYTSNPHTYKYFVLIQSLLRQ